MWPVPKPSTGHGYQRMYGSWNITYHLPAIVSRLHGTQKSFVLRKKKKWCMYTSQNRLGGDKSRITQVAYNLLYCKRSQHCFFNGCSLTTRVPSMGWSTCKIWSGLSGCALVSDAQNQTMWTYVNNTQCCTAVQFSSVWCCGAWDRCRRWFVQGSIPHYTDTDLPSHLHH